MLFFANWPMLAVALALGFSLFPNTSGFVPQPCRSIGTTQCGHPFSSHIIQNVEQGIVCLRMSRSRGQNIGNSLEEHWLPVELLDHAMEDPKAKDFLRGEMEGRSVELAGCLIRQRLCCARSNLDLKNRPLQGTKIGLAVGRFMDLAGTIEGELILESLFDCEEVSQQEDRTIQGAIMVIQSLLIVGSQLGVKGSPEQLHRSVSHLIESRKEAESMHDCISRWDAPCVRRLKYRNAKLAGVQLLAVLQRKRTPQGAYDLLVEIGAWQKHEDLPLLRSGFSIRFSDDELAEAESASVLQHDADALLGLREDLRHQKIYTIDSASTSEIDDGLAVEAIRKEDGSASLRFWIHIADADRWAPRDSKVFQIAKGRGTSLYLPHGSIHMFPSSLSTEVMSLKANMDVCALSLGVELAEDGSIIDSSIIVTPSYVSVSYRLTYDEVDEMLEEGSGYHEEWQLGSLLTAASKRRQFRMRHGSSEEFIPTQIPQFNIATSPDRNAQDGISIQLKVQVSHNSGKNQSVVTASDSDSSTSNEAPVSSACTLVTEMMILAGEAMGKWKLKEDRCANGEVGSVMQHSIRLPFRTQPEPDYRSRSREKSIMVDLLAQNIGRGYCHSWYVRRFLSPVKVSEVAKPHSGLGLECYVQWTSPLRRFCDLQVHCAVKRYLRRRKVNDIMKKGGGVPSGVTPADLGCDIPFLNSTQTTVYNDIDYGDCAGMLGAARTLQRQSQQYWLLEYIRRRKEMNQNVTYNAVVLGCVDPERRQYAVYIYDLGFECKYSTPVGSLVAGTLLRLKVASVFPRSGLLTLTQADI